MEEVTFKQKLKSESQKTPSKAEKIRPGHDNNAKNKT